jgi:hypothetical protein
MNEMVNGVGAGRSQDVKKRTEHAGGLSSPAKLSLPRRPIVYGEEEKAREPVSFDGSEPAAIRQRFQVWAVLFRSGQKI